MAEADRTGPDRDALAARARARNFKWTTKEELALVIFEDGISTSSRVPEISGRGVGMAAVKAVCGEPGIRISIRSITHHGTTFTFDIPFVQESHQEGAA